MVTRDFYSFDAGRRPPIQVEMGRRWLGGELRSWIRRGDGWWAHIGYDVDGRSHLATVPASRIRSTDDRAAAPGSTGSAVHPQL